VTKILLVEDEARALRVMHRALTRRGYEVQTATDADAAIQVGRTFAPHVLLADWSLGGAHDGIYVAETLRALDPDLAIVLFSGLAIDALQTAAAHLPRCVFLQKPFGLHTLETSLQHALQNVNHA
jgi:two-component system response regulator RegA